MYRPVPLRNFALAKKQKFDPLFNWHFPRKTKVQFVGLGQTGSITKTVLYCNVEKCQGELEIRLIHNAAAILSDVVRRHNEEEKEK